MVLVGVVSVGEIYVYTLGFVYFSKTKAKYKKLFTLICCSSRTVIVKYTKFVNETSILIRSATGQNVVMSIFSIFYLNFLMVAVTLNAVLFYEFKFIIIIELQVMLAFKDVGFFLVQKLYFLWLRNSLIVEWFKFFRIKWVCSNIPKMEKRFTLTNQVNTFLESCIQNRWTTLTKIPNVINLRFPFNKWNICKKHPFYLHFVTFCIRNEIKTKYKLFLKLLQFSSVYNPMATNT